MHPAFRRCVSSLLVACVCAASLLAQKGIPAPNRAKLEKLAEPWPDAEVVKARRIDAENRRLFADSAPFPFTLRADFKKINKDRDPESKTDYPAVLTLDAAAGGPAVLHVKLRARGHFRRRATTCSFVPLRVEFDKQEVKGTIFDGQKTLKLVTHCLNDEEYTQYTLREYLVYRILNVLTPMSFRARLAKPTYVQADKDAAPADSTGGKVLVTRWGMFLEDDEDVARRAEARLMEIPRVTFKEIDPESLSLMMVFEYMIGNTDYSIFALHNVRLLRSQDRTIYTVPYDFDLSGLVNTKYAAPTQGLGLFTVRDRLYRGPCRSEAEIGPVLARFTAHKDEVLALYDSLPDLDKEYRRDAQHYLQEFFTAITKPNDVKKTFVDGQCSKKSLM